MILPTPRVRCLVTCAALLLACDEDGGDDGLHPGADSGVERGADGGVDPGLDAGDDGRLSESPRVELPYDRGGTPHAIQLLRVAGFNDDIFVANSFGGFMRYAVGSPLTLRYLTDLTMPREPRVYCLRIAAHVPSGTMFCAGLYIEGVARFDAASGAFRELAAADGVGRVHGMATRGDDLYLATPDRGLWRRPIRADGTLGAPSLVREGQYLHVAEVPGGVAAVSRERGLEVHTDAGVRAVALPGPALSMRSTGDALWVALGSEGVARVDLAGLEVQRLVPGCVASAVHASTTTLVVGCRQGLRVYDLPPPRAPLGLLRASTRAEYSVSDVLVEGDTIHELDWRILRVHSLADLRSRRRLPDAPIGVAVSRSGASRFPVENPFPTAVRFGATVVPPGQRVWGLAAPGDAQIDLGTLRRPEQVVSVATLEEDRPAPGHAAGLGLRDIWVYLLQPDCALQWPDLEDLRWLSMHGGVRDGQGVEVLISTFGPRKELQWLTGLWPGLRFEMLPAVASREAPDVPYERFRPRFSLTRDLGGPDDTVVLNLDASGRVRSVANQYRGRYPLSAERAP